MTETRKGFVLATATNTAGLTRLQRRLPLGYLGSSVLMLALLLPTLLRPAQEQPTTTAEFSPEAPPDEEPQSLFESPQAAETPSLGAGVTGTPSPEGTGPGNSGSGPAGDGTGPGDGDGTGPGPGDGTGPGPGACPYGVGDPPRQIESVYSPACAGAWTGDNGGATYRGVTADSINIAFIPELVGEDCSAGRDPDPTKGSIADRTLRTWERYFNTRYQLYGRQVHFYCVIGDSSGATGPEAGQRRATVAVDEYKAFAALPETNTGAINELIRRQTVTFVLAQLPRSTYAENQPYLWSFTPDSTSLIEMGAEYTCKRLAGPDRRPRPGAGDVWIDEAQPRKFGILAYADPGYAANVDDAKRELAECGVEVAETATYRITGGDPAQEMGTAMQKLATAGVSTIFFLGDQIGGAPVLTHSASSLAYFPEWFLPGFGGVDIARGARGNERAQWGNAFGFSMYEIPTVPANSECYRAYHEVDPGGTPDEDMCDLLWGHVVQLLGGIQEAGPDLTPQSFATGMHRIPASPPDPPWRMAGRYTASDYTYPDYATEIWWDNSAIHPDGAPGAYRYVNGGTRYTHGEWPTSDPTVFKPEGTVTQR